MRTRAQWESIIDAKAITLGLTLSTSQVAEWKLWRDMAVTIAMVLEGIISIFKKESDDHLKNEQHGGTYWYGQISKEFQNGDTLIVDNGILKYDPVDETHRVITQVAVKEVGDDLLVIKVAKIVSGAIVKLSTTEFANYQSYIERRKIPGTKVNTITNDADTVTYDLVVNYDPLFAPATVEANILASLTLFRNNFPFDAVLYKSALIDAIMNAQGVKGIDTFDVTYLTDGTTYPLINYGELVAGYFNYDVASIINLNPA